MPPEPRTITVEPRTPAVWTGEQLRRLVVDIPGGRADYGAWWDSRSGRLLANRIVTDLAAPVARGVKARTGRSVDHGVVLGLVVEALVPPSQLVRALRSPATADPLAYLVRSLVNALAREIGTEAGIDLNEVSWAEESRTRTTRMALTAAVRAVLRELLPGTPPRLRPTLPDALERVVDRARDGCLSRLHTRMALDERLLALGWSREQLRVLVNAVVGTRPDHARTSLLAGFLTGNDWRPRTSPIHRGAIDAYARRMAKWELAHRYVRDVG